MTTQLTDRISAHRHHRDDHGGDLSLPSRTAAGYDPAGQVNLPGYAGSLVAFTVTAGVLGLVGRRSGRRLPQHFELVDVVLGGVATHKFARLLAKGAVTSPVRAPFTEFEEAAGSSEHNESARGERGLRHTIGELLTCPFCLDQWVGSGYVAALVLAPRPARAWAATFAVTGLSDALQQVYGRLRTS